MMMLKDESKSEKQKKNLLMEVQVQGAGGEKGKRIGKAIAEKIFLTFMSSDPSIIIE